MAIEEIVVKFDEENDKGLQALSNLLDEKRLEEFAKKLEEKEDIFTAIDWLLNGR
jgi:DNA-binding MurR/RpiR family transcriptional regulator